MNAIDRYKFREFGNEISFMPNYNLLRTLVWWLGLGIIALPVIIRFMDKMSAYQFRTALIIWSIYMIFLLFELFFRVPVKYIFDKSEKCIYRKWIFSRKLMNFDEMTYFINEDNGGYFYAIGKKRNQFVKSYRISSYFSNSKASERREEEYIRDILGPVLEAAGSSFSRGTGH